MGTTTEKIEEIKREIRQWRDNCYDINVPIGDLHRRIDEGDSGLYQYFQGEKDTGFTRHAESQLLARLAIPGRYIHKCPGNLQAGNINYWIEKYSTATVMLRKINTLRKDYVRAVFSKRYRPMDDYQIIPSIVEIAGELSDKNFENLSIQFYKGEDFTSLDIIYDLLEVLHSETLYYPGVSICNSEVGKSSLWIRPLIMETTNPTYRYKFVDNLETGASRFLHIKEFVAEKITAAFKESLKTAEVGIAHLIQTGTIMVTEPIKEVRKILLTAEAIPHRILTIIEDEYKEVERVSKLNLAKSILRAVEHLPAFQKYMAQAEVGRYLNLFEATNQRLSRIVEQGT